MNETAPVLEARNISKRFAGIQALDTVTVSLKPGVITALIGENGAGKSTLVKILAGYHQSDGGEIYLDGESIDLANVLHAQEKGISVIHQVPSFAPDLSVVDNIFLGREMAGSKKAGRLSRFNREKEIEGILPLMEQYGADIDPKARLKSLKAYQQRLVGILKALVFSARILIMDEPTAALPLEERGFLLEKIRSLKTEGYSILYVSHHLDEIEQVADEVVALRDGKLAGYTDRVPRQIDMIEMMTGRKLSAITEIYDAVPTGQTTSGSTVVTDRRPDHVFSLAPPDRQDAHTLVGDSLRLSFRPGNIVLLTGIVGSGAKDIAEAMYGLGEHWKVVYARNGNSREIHNPATAIGAGIGYLSDDRLGEAVFPDFSVRENMTMPKLRKITTPLGRIILNKERRAVSGLCDKLNVKMTTMEQLITSLSGGNQQKVMLARWLFSEVEFLILNEPTQGIDVMAKRDVIGLLKDFTNPGGTCVIATNDPEEFLHVADRIIVIRRGRIIGDYPSGGKSLDDIMKAMLIHEQGERVHENNR